MKVPILPAAMSWYPGHMSFFMKKLPELLNRTDIVLELRDSRLPLTSINPNFEREMISWKGKAMESSETNHSVGKQRIIVMSKYDLVPEWGIEVRDSISISFLPTLMFKSAVQ
jgi:mitochondrial GTPase 1